jgi:hypothetical protein
MSVRDRCVAGTAGLAACVADILACIGLNAAARARGCKDDSDVPRVDRGVLGCRSDESAMRHPKTTWPQWVCVLALFAVTPAEAQTGGWEDRAFLDVDLAIQTTARPFADVLTPLIYTQPARIVTTHPVAGGAVLLDVAGGVRLRWSLGVGLGYTKFALTEVAGVAARIPAPVPSNAARSATATAEVTRADTAFHILAVWLIPITDHIDVAFSGGPSLISVKQDRVSEVTIAEDSPTLATVAISKVGLVSHEDRVLGMHGGVDVTYFLTPMVGVGGAVRFVRGSSQAGAGQDGGAPIDVGGLQIGVGVRFRMR